eukprot:3959772-Pyramimonas_sp.AAC.1
MERLMWYIPPYLAADGCDPARQSYRSGETIVHTPHPAVLAALPVQQLCSGSRASFHFLARARYKYERAGPIVTEKTKQEVAVRQKLFLTWEDI